jgi:hypothetical protein
MDLKGDICFTFIRCQLLGFRFRASLAVDLMSCAIKHLGGGKTDEARCSGLKDDINFPISDLRRKLRR